MRTLLLLSLCFSLALAGLGAGLWPGTSYNSREARERAQEMQDLGFLPRTMTPAQITAPWDNTRRATLGLSLCVAALSLTALAQAQGRARRDRRTLGRVLRNLDLTTLPPRSGPAYVPESLLAEVDRVKRARRNVLRRQSRSARLRGDRPGGRRA